MNLTPRTHCVFDSTGTCVCPIRQRWPFPNPPDNIPCSHITEFDVQTQPRLSRLIGKYLLSLSRWVASGAPKRSAAGIEAARKACESCEHFAVDASGGGTCTKCGCGCGGKRPLLANKWAWATESCPLDPPRWKPEAMRRVRLMKWLGGKAVRLLNPH